MRVFSHKKKKKKKKKKKRSVNQINKLIFRWCGNVVWSVEKSYVDNLEALKILDLN